MPKRFKLLEAIMHMIKVPLPGDQDDEDEKLQMVALPADDVSVFSISDDAADEEWCPAAHADLDDVLASVFAEVLLRLV